MTLPSSPPSAARRPSRDSPAVNAPLGIRCRTRSVAVSTTYVAFSAVPVRTRRSRRAPTTGATVSGRPTRRTRPSCLPLRTSKRRTWAGCGTCPAAAKNVVTSTVPPPAPNRMSVKPYPSPERGSENLDVAHRASGRRVDQPHELTSPADAGVDGQQLAVRREVEAHDGAVRPDRTADPPARPRVEAHEGPALAAGGEHPPVGAQRQRVERVPVALHHADRAGRADERRQEMAAGDRGVVEHAAGLGEQEAPVEPVVDQRLRAEPLGVGGPGGVARVVALPERQQARHRPRRRAARRRRRAARAGGGWPAAAPGARARTRRRSRRGTRARPRSAHRGVPAPIRVRRRAGCRGRGPWARAPRPPRCARRRRAAGAGAVPRGPPRASRRRVGHSRISTSCATSAVPSPSVTSRASAKRSEQVADGVARDALGDELVDRHAAPRVLDPVAELRQPQEHVAQQVRALRRGPPRRARPPTARRPTSPRRSAR